MKHPKPGVPMTIQLANVHYQRGLFYPDVTVVKGDTKRAISPADYLAAIAALRTASTMGTPLQLISP